MATDEELPDLEFAVRREFPAFKPFPNMVDWTDGKPELPPGFKVAVIGSGFPASRRVSSSGCWHPLCGSGAQGRPGRHLDHPPLSRRSGGHGLITYEFAFEKLYQWSEYFGPGADVRGYLDHVSKKYGVFQNTRFNCDMKRATFDETTNVWTLEVETRDGMETMTANAVISASGLFANNRCRTSRPGDVRGPNPPSLRWPEART